MSRFTDLLADAANTSWRTGNYEAQRAIAIVAEWCDLNKVRSANELRDLLESSCDNPTIYSLPEQSASCDETVLCACSNRRCRDMRPAQIGSICSQCRDGTMKQCPAK